MATSPNPSTAATDPSPSSPPPSSHTVDSIGASFVSQYYNSLIKDPSKLHKYYKNESRFSHVDAHGRPFTAHGQDAIKKCLADLQLSECKARVCEVECQESLNGSVIIVVEGYLSNKGSPMKRFIQTFLLAAQTMGYYVLNDIFRYILEDAESKADESPSSPVPVPAAAPVAIPPSPPIPAPAVAQSSPSPTPVEVAPTPVQVPPPAVPGPVATGSGQETAEAPEESETESTAATGGTTSGGSVKSDEFEPEHDDSKRKQTPPQSRPLSAQQRPKEKERRDKRRKQDSAPASAPIPAVAAPAPQEPAPPKSAWNVPSTVATPDTVSAENPTPKEASKRRPADRNAEKPADKPKDKPAVISSYAAAVGNASSDKGQHAETEQQQAPAARQERSDPRKQTGTSSGSEQPPTSERRPANGWSDFSSQKRSHPFENTKYQLFVGNLPRDTTDDEIRSLFASCDKILFIKNRAFEKAVAFVNFETQAGLDSALRLTPAIRGTLLKLDVGNRPNFPRPSGPSREMRREGFERRDNFDRRFDRHEGAGGGGFGPRKDGGGSNSARDRYPRRDEPAPSTENGSSGGRDRDRDRDGAFGSADRRPGSGFRGGPRNSRFGSREFGRGFNRPSFTPVASSSSSASGPAAPASPSAQQAPSAQ